MVQAGATGTANAFPWARPEPSQKQACTQAAGQLQAAVEDLKAANATLATMEAHAAGAATEATKN